MSRHKPVDGFKKEDFGWLKRWWKQNDHLVVLGYNHATEKYFTLVRRQVRDVLRQADLPLKRRHSPETRAKVAIAMLGVKTTPKYRYKGSLEVSRTATSHRHFVFVELYDAPSESHPKGYYFEYDAFGTSGVFGQYESEVVDYIISQTVLSPPLDAVA